MRILLISELSRLGRNVDEVLKNVMPCNENKRNVYFRKRTLEYSMTQVKNILFSQFSLQSLER